MRTLRSISIFTVSIILSISDPLLAAPVDLLIHNSVIYDGTGAKAYRGSVAVKDGRITAIGALSDIQADQVIDAGGLALAPGFTNMLSWASESLLIDGRGMSDLKQGITLEVFGEGDSFGPLSAETKAALQQELSAQRIEVSWNTLGEFLELLSKKGTSVNVASFLGAGTIRAHVLGFAFRAPNAQELTTMQELVRAGMREGALGISSALIWPPSSFARQDELIALAKTAGEFGGGYASHILSEGNELLESLDDFFEIVRAANVHGEIFHLKAAGRDNWRKMPLAVTKIATARQQGLSVTANMYTYTAAGTSFQTSMPPWVQTGGIDAWVKRLTDPKIRQRLLPELRNPGKDWESAYLASGADGVQLLSFKNDKLKPLEGKTLGEVAKLRGTSPEETMIDLIIEDHSRVEVAYFMMSEDNVRLGLSQPWVSIGSDEAAPAAEGQFLLNNPHPRAYGNIARLLGHYVREKRLMSLEEAIRRITRLPAQNFKIRDRGCIDIGCHADIVLFDPETIADHATFTEPHRYASGVVHVFVNGVQVLKNGEHTGAMPGQVVRGPGWQGWKQE